MKLTNPLYYPLAVLAGGIILIFGVRFFKLPNFLMLPTSVAVTTVSASLLHSREPNEDKIAKKQLQSELKLIKLSAVTLADRAQVLRQESQQLLSQNSWQIDLLVAVQQACDRAIELPAKVESMAKRLPDTESLLSINDLQLQLSEAQNKLQSSTGVARQNLQQLVTKLEQNIQLAQTGQDTRTAQIINLQMLIQESAGMLQELQNKLRTSDLNNSEEIQELRNLSNELNSVLNLKLI